MMGAVTPETSRVALQQINIYILLHLVGFLFILNYDARNHELKISLNTLTALGSVSFESPADSLATLLCPSFVFVCLVHGNKRSSPNEFPCVSFHECSTVFRPFG